MTDEDLKRMDLDFTLTPAAEPITGEMTSCYAARRGHSGITSPVAHVAALTAAQERAAAVVPALTAAQERAAAVVSVPESEREQVRAHFEDVVSRGQAKE